MCRASALTAVVCTLLQFSIFHLGHPNILPVGDLGVRKVGCQVPVAAGAVAGLFACITLHMHSTCVCACVPVDSAGMVCANVCVCLQGLAHLCGLKHLPGPQEMQELTAGA